MCTGRGAANPVQGVVRAADTAGKKKSRERMMNLHVSDISRWHLLLGRAQMETEYYLQPEVEAYLAQALYRMAAGQGSPRSMGHLVDSPGLNPAFEEKLLRHMDVIEQCLLMGGLFPGHATDCGLPLQLFIDKGTESCRALSDAFPETVLFVNLKQSFVQVLDVLHCASVLTGGISSTGLFHAFELWQSGGSKRGFNMLVRETAALPGGLISEAMH